MDSCPLDTMGLFFLDGVSIRQIARTPVLRDSSGASFVMNFSNISPGFYFVGGGEPTNTRQVLLGIDRVVVLEGAWENFFQAKILGSRANDALQQALQIADQLQQQSNQLNRQYQAAKNSGQDLAVLTENMNQIDQQKLALLDSLNQVHPLLKKALALRTYLISPDIQAKYTSELDFFASTYFSQATLSDSAYFHMPLFNEAFQSYGFTLGSISSLPHEGLLEYCERYLSQLPTGPAHKMAILGLSAGFREKNEDAFVHFAQQYLSTYGPSDNPVFAQQLTQEISTKKALVIGATAPDLSLPTPAGDTLAISDLRGQVVLLDFWASWCRPCRMENPRVKAMYEAHKDEGFTILGLSLDRSQEAWEKAIEDDQLPWHHVSDLLFWSSIAAKTYKVSSIPYTVLLDREGKIVAKGLRGPALEAKLNELLSQQPDQR